MLSIQNTDYIDYVDNKDFIGRTRSQDISSKTVFFLFFFFGITDNVYYPYIIR